MTTPASLPWIERLLRFNTISSESNRALIDDIAGVLREHGIEPVILPDETGAKANLLATIPAHDGTRAGGVVLSGHTDVVPVEAQPWTSDPFEPVIRDGRLIARGSADMKAFCGILLHALPQMLEAELAEPIHLAFSYDEEIGCVGAVPMVKALADDGLSPRLAIIGEPTMMAPIRAHKSMTVVKVTFRGLAGHSSLTTSGVNSIEHAAGFISGIRATADRWKQEGPFDEDFPVPHSTASVNIVHGGIAGNIIPAETTVQLEFRTLDPADHAAMHEQIRSESARIEAVMQAEHPSASVEVEVLADALGLDTAADAEIISFLAELGIEERATKVTFGTEAGIFDAAGIQSVVLGPGDIAQAHTPDEFIELEQIEAGEAFIARLIAHLDTRGA